MQQEEGNAGERNLIGHKIQIDRGFIVHIDDESVGVCFAVSNRQGAMKVKLSAQRVGMLRIRLLILTVAA